MEQQQSSNSYHVSDEDPLTLPHFDDEVTIQSARPVVPLHEIKATARSKHRLLLTGALCVAALIGAVTASLIYDRRSQPGLETTINSSPLASSGFVAPSSEAAGAQVDPDAAVEPGSDSRAAKQADGEGHAEASKSSIRQARAVRNPPVKVVRSTEAQDRTEPNVLADEERQWELRREARRLRRERRVNDRRRDNELTRIREIFEGGSPRP